MKPNKQIVAIGLAVVGLILFLAVNFELLAPNVGKFGGMVFFMLSGLTWAFWPRE